MLNAQVLVNRDWVELSGNPSASAVLSDWDLVDWTSSALDGQGNLIVVGNTLESAGNTDVLTTKFDRSGGILWEQTFGGTASGYDYGVSVLVDNQDNIFVAGVVSLANGQSAIQILKYNPTGSLIWSTQWNNSVGNMYDLPTSLALDGLGNVVVIGATFDASLQTDWVVLQLDPVGTLLWSKMFDYAGYHDLPTTVNVSASNDIEVLGFSENAPSSINLVVVEFSHSGGTILAQEAKFLPEVSGTSPTSVAIDGAHNIYIGATTNDSSNPNIKLIKINAAYDVEWVKELDEAGLADAAKSIALDSQGDIIVAGESKNGFGGAFATIAKYSSSGEEIFSTELVTKMNIDKVSVTKVKVDVENNVFLLGEKERSADKDIMMAMYDPQGQILALKEYSGGNEVTDKSRDIQLSPYGDIFVTGRSFGQETQYVTVKYERFERDTSLVYEGNKPSHRATELIVRFKPEYVNTAFVDDGRVKFGEISDALLPNAASAVQGVLSGLRTTVSKIYRMKTTETWSVTRLGDTIPIPVFWSSLLFHFSPYLESELDLDVIIAELKGLEFVEYAEKNSIYELQSEPNDTYYSEQKSLMANDNSAIDVESAWNFVTGKSYIRVGVVDQPIYWKHEDFHLLADDLSFSGSQIKGGHDYINNVDISDIDNPAGSHGTAVAGIIGAVRNNGIGIAGIAGGDGELAGVSLYSLAIFDGNGNTATTELIASAMSDGATDNNQNHYGVHIMNNSWSGPSANELEKAIHYALANQVVSVAAKGNYGTSYSWYPASYVDYTVLSVGASGLKGELKIREVGQGDEFRNDCEFNAKWGSSYGPDMDFIAPGVTELVKTTINPNAPETFYCPIDINKNNNLFPLPFGDTKNYQAFNGTSAAAPHVSGVVALLLSLHNTNNGYSHNLSPEDVESILEITATDVVGGDLMYPVGHDDWNGAGLINAAKAVQYVQLPWKVYHSESPSTVNVKQLDDLGEYKVYRVEHVYNLSFPGFSVIQSWGRYSSTIGAKDLTSSGKKYTDWADYSQMNVSINGELVEVVVYTYVYEKNDGSVTYPTGGVNSVKTAFSLLLKEKAMSIESKLLTGEKIFIRPNPSTGHYYIDINLTKQNDISLFIRDINGQTLEKKYFSFKGTKTIDLDLSSYSEGVYFCQILGAKTIVSKKLIKN